MAKEEQQQRRQQEEDSHKLLRSYLGLSFSMFLATFANNSVPALQSKVRLLSQRAAEAAEELRQMKSRRQEDSKANARVVEIFASHRNAWQAEEKRLLQQIDAATEEIARLRGRVAELEECAARAEKEVAERDEMIGFMSRRIEEEGLGGREHYGKKSGEWFQKEEEEEMVGSTRSLEEEVEVIYEQHSQHFGNNGFDSEFLASASKFWAEKASLWQDVQYESLESMYDTKHFVARRESPWKVDGDSAGISPKFKLLEQDLSNLEKIGKNDPSKVSSLIKKQAKRYQTLLEKIDDLCQRIEANDPCEPSLSSEFRTQTQTEFLLEAFRLQQGVSETRQNLMALQTEIGKSNYRDELSSETSLTTRRSWDSTRNNFKEIQRNMEIWLARVIGDLEGILSREGASRVREYYISRYPFVQ